MLSKKKRVTKNTFHYIMDKGNVVSGSFFVFRYIKQAESQYAFVVSKKMAKTATKRNSLRRKGYNILRFFNLTTCAGIFFYKKEALKVNTPEIKADIEYILKKSGII